MIDPQGSLENYFRTLEALRKPKPASKDTDVTDGKKETHEQAAELLKKPAEIVPLHVEQLHPDEE